MIGYPITIHDDGKNATISVDDFLTIIADRRSYRDSMIAACDSVNEANDQRDAINDCLTDANATISELRRDIEGMRRELDNARRNTDANQFANDTIRSIVSYCIANHDENHDQVLLVMALGYDNPTGAHKINAIKYDRIVSGRGLKESKEYVESLIFAYNDRSFTLRDFLNS